MPQTRSAVQVLDEEFLTLRAKVLEVASGLDRLDRADGEVLGDSRRQNLAAAIRLLLEEGSGRAEKVQLLFSREYQADWPKELDVAVGKDS